MRNPSASSATPSVICQLGIVPNRPHGHAPGSRGRRRDRTTSHDDEDQPRCQPRSAGRQERGPVEPGVRRAAGAAAEAAPPRRPGQRADATGAAGSAAQPAGSGPGGAGPRTGGVGVAAPEVREPARR